MYKKIKNRIYSLFTDKGIGIEVNDSIGYANFCCLKIKYYPITKVTLNIGRFTDDLLEILLITHKFGHILHYETLSPDEAQIAYCTIFASNNMGLKISPWKVKG
ncbi:MAG: hypothetical protein NTY95_18885 [Bacteroidia bacterium]|nr:hypothetical protein [Bacteroidia bacterium]